MRLLHGSGPAGIIARALMVLGQPFTALFGLRLPSEKPGGTPGNFKLTKARVSQEECRGSFGGSVPGPFGRRWRATNFGKGTSPRRAGINGKLLSPSRVGRRMAPVQK